MEKSNKCTKDCSFFRYTTDSYFSYQDGFGKCQLLQDEYPDGVAGVSPRSVHLVVDGGACTLQWYEDLASGKSKPEVDDEEPPEFLVCKRCKQKLPSDNFHKNVGRRYNLATICKSCVKKKYQEKRRLNTGKKAVFE